MYSVTDTEISHIMQINILELKTSKTKEIVVDNNAANESLGSHSPYLFWVTVLNDGYKNIVANNHDVTMKLTFIYLYLECEYKTHLGGILYRI